MPKRPTPKPASGALPPIPGALTGRKLSYQMLDPRKCRVNPDNPRTIEPEHRAALKRGIETLGWVDPIILRAESKVILGGHQRREIALELKYSAVPVVLVHGLTDAEATALTILLNNPGAQGSWDNTKLAASLAGLTLEGFDLSITGFDDLELKRIVQVAGHDRQLADPNEIPPVPAEAITQPGDLIQLGEHRLLCGDCTSAENVARVMGTERAGLMMTDPPYGVSYVNSDRPQGNRVTMPAIAGDQFRDDALQAFLESAFRPAVASALNLNAAWYLWHAHLTQGFFAAAAAAAAARVVLSRQIIWVKPSLLLTRGQYHWKHEPCFFGWVQGHQPPDYGRGKGERDQTTVWEVQGVPRDERKEYGHATPKPIELFEIAIVKHLQPGEICYEPFAGSGPQFIAAEKLGRRCYGLELEPTYCDVIVARWERFTGQTAVRPAR